LAKSTSTLDAWEGRFALSADSAGAATVNTDKFAKTTHATACAVILFAARGLFKSTSRVLADR
jgi:hypothetical protein